MIKNSAELEDRVELRDAEDEAERFCEGVAGKSMVAPTSIVASASIVAV